jgi:hypothetical protein
MQHRTILLSPHCGSVVIQHLVSNSLYPTGYFLNFQRKTTASNNVTSCTNVVSLRVWYKFVNFNSTFVICLKLVFIEMLNKLITYIVCWYKTFIRSCLLCELTASLLISMATHSYTDSHYSLDLIQSLVPPHYVCNGYISIYIWVTRSVSYKKQSLINKMCTILWGRLHFVYDDTLFSRFIHQRQATVFCLTFQWHDVMSKYFGREPLVQRRVNLLSTQCGDTTSFIRSCPLRELTASQLVVIANRGDTGSHNRLDLIQSLVPPHYVRTNPTT